MHPRFLTILAVAILSANAARLQAEQPVTLENVSDPGANRLDEPKAPEFSLKKAVRFLDSASLQWQKKRKCFTCHTNYAYLYARPLVSADAPAHRSVRDFAEELVQDRWKVKGPRWDAEVIATAAALAFNDAKTTKKLHPATRAALDRMWTVQRKDGGWNWLKCGWPPMESDDDYGVVLAALATVAAPGNYAAEPQAQAGLDNLRTYLKKNPPPTLHHEAMLLWAASYRADLMPEKERRAVIQKLSALQKQDGGWALASLGDWKRADGKTQDFKNSDGYATGFVTYVLQRAGVKKTDPRIVASVAWLKHNQRESGRWITRSLNKDNKHFISHAGTAFAVMAVAEFEAAKEK